MILDIAYDNQYVEALSLPHQKQTWSNTDASDELNVRIINL